MKYTPKTYLNCILINTYITWYFFYLCGGIDRSFFCLPVITCVNGVNNSGGIFGLRVVEELILAESMHIGRIDASPYTVHYWLNSSEYTCIHYYLFFFILFFYISEVPKNNFSSINLLSKNETKWKTSSYRFHSIICRFHHIYIYVSYNLAF